MFFLFLARLRFSSENSIIKILQRCYGDGLIKKVRKFEKFDSSSLCMIFDSISSNIDEVLSINPSVNVFVFGDFNIHHKSWLTYSGGADQPGELSYIYFFISNDLTQMVNFPTRIPDCNSHNPALLDLFLSSDGFIVLQWLSLHWVILIILLTQFPMTFHQIDNGIPRFIA